MDSPNQQIETMLRRVIELEEGHGKSRVELRIAEGVICILCVILVVLVIDSMKQDVSYRSLTVGSLSTRTLEICGFSLPPGEGVRLDVGGPEQNGGKLLSISASKPYVHGMAIELSREKGSALRLGDNQGNPRLSLETHPDGKAGLWLYDKENNARFSATTSVDGVGGNGAALWFSDQAGRNRLGLGNLKEDEFGYSLFDRSGVIRCQLAAGLPDGSVALGLSDANGTLRETAAISGLTSLHSFWDPEGKERIEITTQPSGLAGQTFSDNKGKERVRIGTAPMALRRRAFSTTKATNASGSPRTLLEASP